MNTIYEEITFVDNGSPDINANNLNHISHSLAQIDERVVSLGAYEAEAQASAESASESVTLCQAEVSKAKAEVTKAQQEAESARGYAEQAHYYSDHAFSGTPEGYSQLVDDVYSLHTTENKDFNSVKGKIMPIRIDGKSEKTDSVITSVGDYGLVDLGGLEWSYSSSDGRFYTTSITNCQSATLNDQTLVANAICSKYAITSRSGLVNGSMSLHRYSGGMIWNVIDTSYTDVTSFKAMLDRENVQLCYELATGSTSTNYGLGIKEHGKNLFDWYTELSNYELSGELYQGNKVITSTRAWGGAYDDNVILEAGKTYTISAMVNISGGKVSLYGTSTSSVTIANITVATNQWVKISKTYTPTTDVSRIRIENPSSATTKIACFQIEEGSSATDYLPYSADKIILPLSAPLRSVGTVKDTIEDGKIVRRVGCYTFTGSENLTNQTSTTNYKWYSATLPNCKNLGSVFSDAFLSTDFTYTSSTSDTLGAFLRYSDLYFSFPKSTTASSFVSGKSIIYELATPTTEELTPSQQKALCSLKSYEGHTYLEAVGLEPTINVKYADYEVSALALEGYVEAKYNRALIEDNLATVQAMILELETES